MFNYFKHHELRFFKNIPAVAFKMKYLHKLPEMNLFFSLSPRKLYNYYLFWQVFWLTPSLNYLPIRFRTVAWVSFNDFGGAYSSGSVQDLHLIPFSSIFRRNGILTPKIAAKIKIISQSVPPLIRNLYYCLK